jgi:hypothetical protein
VRYVGTNGDVILSRYKYADHVYRSEHHKAAAAVRSRGDTAGWLLCMGRGRWRETGRSEQEFGRKRCLPRYATYGNCGQFAFSSRCAVWRAWVTPLRLGVRSTPTSIHATFRRWPKCGAGTPVIDGSKYGLWHRKPGLDLALAVLAVAKRAGPWILASKLPAQPPQSNPTCNNPKRCRMMVS